MRGKAGGRWIDADGTKRYHAFTTAEVSSWLKLVPTHLELQVRLRWWRTILMDREGNEALLGIFFGRLGAEVEGQVLGKWYPFTQCPPVGAAAVGRSPLLDRHPGLAGEHAKVGHRRGVPSNLL